MMAVLEVEAEGNVGTILKEDIVNKTVNNIINKQGLYNSLSS
jgi:hypothetical protein